MQLSDFLEAITPPQLINCEPHCPIETTTNPAHSREYLSDLTEWVGIKGDIKEFLGSKLSFETAEFGHADFIQSHANRAALCSNESDVLSLGCRAYETPALLILEQCFGIDGDFCDHEGGRILGDPDRVFVVICALAERSRGKLVLEWKVPWVLVTPDNLIKEFNSGRLRDEGPTKVVKAVSQLYGYMTYNNLKFGALCNYESLYLFQRVGDSGLQVSPPFRFSDRGTESPVAALVYICHHVVTIGSSHHSSVGKGLQETITLRIDNITARGTLGERNNTEILWERMNLHLDKWVRKNIATVMLGEVRSQLGVNPRVSRRAVFKIYETNTSIKEKAADQEIRAYENLKGLQGKYIPRLYAAGTHMKSLKILILEDCGTAASADRVDADFWTQARKCVQALHKAGAIHGDIKLDNFTTSKSGARLIDLGLCHQGTPRERAEELRDFDRLKKEWYKSHVVEGEDEDA